LLQVLEQRYSIPVRQFADFTLETDQADGVFLVEVEIVQQPGKSDDVGVLVFDDENWKLWRHNQQAIKAGATATVLEKPHSFADLKLIRGAVAFSPPKTGTYHGILDNTYSVWTPKVVQLRAYWMWFEDSRFRFIDHALKKRKLNDIANLIDNAKAALESGRTIDVCNSLRMALVSLWAKVIEIKTGQKAPLEKGKTPDVGSLGDGLTQEGMAEDSVSVIKRVWSYASELAHVEKTEARPPAIDDANFAFGLTVAATIRLLRLLPEEHDA
jgi:hypothetical protein